MARVVQLVIVGPIACILVALDNLLALLALVYMSLHPVKAEWRLSDERAAGSLSHHPSHADLAHPRRGAWNTYDFYYHPV